jgi:hypothetical protein
VHDCCTCMSCCRDVYDISWFGHWVRTLLSITAEKEQAGFGGGRRSFVGNHEGRGYHVSLSRSLGLGGRQPAMQRNFPGIWAAVLKAGAWRLKSG